MGRPWTHTRVPRPGRSRNGADLPSIRSGFRPARAPEDRLACDFANFDLSAMLRVSQGLRRAVQGGACMEAAAEHVCRYLYDELVEGGRRACVLVRFYKTHPYGALRPELPGLLDAVVMKAMEKDPAARYQSWLDFGKDLSQAFASLRMAGASVSESERFTKLRDFPFFVEFNDVALWELIRIGAWKTFGAQASLIREGETGDSFYFLIEGEVDVTLSGKPLASIKAGRCFGELVFFADKAQRRTTTVTARGPITVMEVKAQAMRAATDALQSAFTKACMRILIERLVYSNERLAQAA